MASEQVRIFFNLLAANVYITSLFSFIGQLADTDINVSKALKNMRSKLFGGPGNWLPPSLLTSLKKIGFPAELRDVMLTSIAAKIRVAINTQVDLPTLTTETGLAVRAFRANNEEEHEHWEWHHNAFCIEIAISLREFR